MILQINQTAASGRNEFEIKENGQLLFRAAAPFYKPVTPVGGDVFRKLTLTGLDNSLLLSTDYNAAENLAAAFLPMSWLVKDSKQVRRYSVTDGSGQVIGRFYYEQSGVADTKLVIEHGDRLFVCYRKEAGKKEVVSFYDGDTQIGQLTKPNCVVNNLDRYLAHLLDGVLDQKIISLFVVYYDFLYHNHSGEIAKGRRANTTYTFDKNSKKYNKRFIAEHFGNDENERVEQFIKDAYSARKSI